MTQIDLARKTGIRANTINEYYHEMVDRVNIEHLDKLCEVLDCDLNDLLQREPGNRVNRSNKIIRGKNKN